MREIGTSWDRENRNTINDNFRESKNRVDNLILNTPQPSEVVDIRVDEEGNLHTTAKERIDSEAAKRKAKDDELTGRLTEIAIDVKTFGAKGDGITDDTIALQDAFSYAEQHNKRVMLERGKVYHTTAELAGQKALLNGNGSTIQTTAPRALNIRGVEKGVISLTADYAAGDYKITLSDVSSIEVGDLLSIRSTKLYNTSRTYYYTGGNVLVTAIIGNDVYISMPLRDSIPANTTTPTQVTGIFIYDPAIAVIENLNVVGLGDINQTDEGIFVGFAKNSKLNNIYVDNFDEDISVQRSVNVNLDGIETGRAINYGVVNRSCTNFHIENSNCHSGIVGFDTGGNETIYNVTARNCSFGSGTQSYGLSMHENAYNGRFVDCEIIGLKLAGNIVMENCVVGVYKGKQNYAYLSLGETYDKNSYRFKDCSFLEVTFRLSGDHQVETLTRKYLRHITFERCRGVRTVYLDLELTYGSPITAEIDRITIDQTDHIDLRINDNVKEIIFINSKSQVNSPVITQLSNKGKVSRLLLDGFGLPETNRTLKLLNFDLVNMHDCYNLSVGSGSNNMEFDSANGKVNIKNSELTTPILVTNSISKLVTDGEVSFTTGSLAKITTKKKVVYENIV